MLISVRVTFTHYTTERPYSSLKAIFNPSPKLNYFPVVFLMIVFLTLCPRIRKKCACLVSILYM